MPEAARPLLIAHRGGRCHGPDNALGTFHRGAQLGATGLETDVRLSADGVVVCAHDETVGWRRRPVRSLGAAALGERAPTLEAVLTDPRLDTLPVSVDVKDPAAWGPMLDLVRALGVGPRLWACGTVAELRAAEASGSGAGLVVSVPRDRLRLDDLGPAQAVNLRHDRWDAALLAQVRSLGLEAFAWGLKGVPGSERRALALGVDAIYGDDVPAMVRAAGRE